MASLTGYASRTSFALIHSGTALPDFEAFALGTAEYPDRSTILIVEVDTLTEGPELVLRGPGIKDTSSGGERAIENAHHLLAYERRGDPAVPDLSLAQISAQFTLAVDRVMTEARSTNANLQR